MPTDFYKMRVTDFRLMVDGFWERRKYEQHLLRRVAYITHASLIPKPLSPNKLWPIDDVESKPLTEEDLKERSKNILERLALMEKIENEKKKRGGA